MIAYLGTVAVGQSSPEQSSQQPSIQFADRAQQVDRPVGSIDSFADVDDSVDDVQFDQLQFDQVGVLPFEDSPEFQPGQMLEQINNDLASSMGRELSQFESIKEGLEQLRLHNQALREEADSERSRAKAARRRMLQSQQLAEEAKRSADEANGVALETISRISRLERELVELSNAKPNQAPSIVASPVPTPNMEAALPSQMAQSIAPQIEAEAPEATADSSPQQTPTNRHPPSRPITDAAVDRQSLADNLFGAKEYRLAMQVYGQLADDPPHGSNESWFKFQIAGCLRNLKEFDKAERYYRMVVGSKDELLAPTARWWLSTIEEQKLISEQVVRWDGLFQQRENKNGQKKRSG